MIQKKLILGSTSKYRKELLERLAIPFDIEAPKIDEDSEKDLALSPLQLAEKLAFLKAQSLKGPNKVIIGGDQLVSFEGEILGKAGTVENAFQQIKKMQGKTHQLITTICVFDGDEFEMHTNITELEMHALTDESIKKYIALDNPIDCAGSYKIEKHGIKLFRKIKSEDFTAIQGLPLMKHKEILEGKGL